MNGKPKFSGGINRSEIVNHDIRVDMKLILLILYIYSLVKRQIRKRQSRTVRLYLLTKICSITTLKYIHVNPPPIAIKHMSEL